ncbi:MAG: hypothetical protein EOP86_20275 [Verrucomicrobiaceae bacterium]|nr:MAG: hypothetical protein EOP86_20275 [Verrucomicrobiaceae bacterium]
MNRALNPRRAGCLQLMLISFMLLGAALFAKTGREGRGGGIDRRGFLYMAVLSGACLVWLRK